MGRKSKGRIRGYEAMGTKRKDRIRGYGGDDYETMGTKRKDRIRGYGVNGSEMYSQWYQHFDDNSTQGKSRKSIIERSNKYDELQGQRGYDPLIGKHSVGGGGGAGGSVAYRYFSPKQNSDGSSHSQGGRMMITYKPEGVATTCVAAKVMTTF